MSTPDRLSSDNLYHFKKDPKVVESILTNGFRHNLLVEGIPYKNSKQQNFMVCFCDIRIEDAEFHRSVYGNNAFVLTKDWGRRMGISPMRYVHQNSPGVSQEYIQSKNRFREIVAATNAHPGDVVVDYTIFSLLMSRNLLTHDSLQDDVSANPSLSQTIQTEEDNYLSIRNTLEGSGQLQHLDQFLAGILNSIYALHNELEHRDAFLRIYQEDFPPTGTPIVKDKILYDEREWRSVKFPAKADNLKGVTDKHLPPTYNLKFSDADLLAVLCQDQPTLNSLKDYIENNPILTDKDQTIAKLGLIDDHKE